MACATERGNLLPAQIGRFTPDLTKIQKKVKKKAFFYMPLLLAYILRFFERFFYSRFFTGGSMCWTTKFRRVHNEGVIFSDYRF